MASKQNATTPGEPPLPDGGAIQQPPEKRTGISEDGRKWLEENAEALRSMNEWVEKNGLPLAKYRKF